MELKELLKIYTQLTPENQKAFKEHLERLSEEVQKERAQGNEELQGNICEANR